MSEPKVTTQAERQFPIRWGDDSALAQVLVDELLFQFVNERAYLTFGQIRMPLAVDETSNATVEIRPVARLVVSQDALGRMVEVLNKVLKDHTRSK